MIAVLDYGIGNLRSAQKGLACAAGPGADVRLVTRPEEAAGATGVVLPGVGNFGRCMQALTASGLDTVVKEAVAHGTPFLGVCVGMQMLFEGSDESPDVPGLGVLSGRVLALAEGVKHPQMQWNQLRLTTPNHPLFDGIDDGSWVYFVHSYVPVTDHGVLATADYGGDVVAVVGTETVWATQFHPEKSGAIGLRLLANFGRIAEPVEVELFPAIDIRGGRAVRLRQGDYGAETIYDDDPVSVALGFANVGTKWIHVVDLDAARTGDPRNRKIVAAIAAAAGVNIQSGGGVRTVAAAKELWDLGVTRVVVGSAAVSDPDLVRTLAEIDAPGVAVGLDTKAGQVAIHGWTETTGLAMGDALDRFAGLGIGAAVITDIGRDGMLEGPDLDGLAAALDRSSIEIVASGGVSAAADVVALAGLRGPVSGRRLAGVVVGKAIYEGRLSVAEGVAACAASV